MKRKTARTTTVTVGLLYLVLCLQTSVYAQDARLTNIIVTNTQEDLLLYLTVEGAFTDKMQKAILSGLPASFSFFVELYKPRSFWINKKISDIRVIHTIKYNTLKKEFQVTRSWENNKPIITESFEEAKRVMSEVDSLKIIPLTSLARGHQYQIRAKAELSKLTLPFYLHYVLFFVSFWDFETDWYTIEFIY